MQFKALSLQLLSLSVAVFGLTGCPDSKPKQEAPNPRQVENDWNVDGTKVTCSSRHCPNALGVLLSVSRTETDHSYYKTVETQVSRCTATLINPRQLVTAGHCLKDLPNTNIYFRTVEAPGRPSRTFKIRGVAARAHNPNGVFDRDFAVLNLASAAEGYDYFQAPTRDSYSALNDLTALVINQPVDWDNYKFTLDSVSCRVSQDDFYPDMQRLPAVFGVENCRLVSGNSGGPVVAPMHPKQILGVLSKSTEADSEDPSKPTKKGLNQATLSNAACIQVPGWTRIDGPCTDFTADYAEKKLKAEREKVAREFVEREMIIWQNSSLYSAEIGTAVYRMVPMFADLKPTGLSSDEIAGYALFPQPACVLGGSPSKGQVMLTPLYREMVPGSGRVEGRTFEPIVGNVFYDVSALADDQIALSMIPMLYDRKWQLSEESAAELKATRSLTVGTCRGDELEIAAQKMIEALTKD